MEHYNLDEFPSVPFALKLIRNRGICGLVVGHLRDPEIVRAAELQGVALVAERQFEHILPLHCVRAGRFLEGKEVVRRVAAAGYRRILALQYWHQPHRLEDDYARYGGLVAGAEAVARDFGAELHIEAQPELGDVRAWQRLRRKHRVDAVIGFNPAVLEPMKQAGWALPPRGPGVAVLELSTPDSHGIPMAGCTSELDRVAAVAVEWLDQMLRLGELGVPESPRVQLVEPRWVDGESLPARVPPELPRGAGRSTRGAGKSNPPARKRAGGQAGGASTG